MRHLYIHVPGGTIPNSPKVEAPSVIGNFCISANQ